VAQWEDGEGSMSKTLQPDETNTVSETFVESLLT